MAATDPAGLFCLGLLYGATVCSITCLPYLGPYLLGTGNGFKDGVFSALLFLLGKVCCYAVLGGLAGLCGQALVASDTLLAIMGAAVILAGISLPAFGGRSCGRPCRQAGRRLTIFALGTSTSLVPCPPVSAMLLLAAERGSAAAGMVYGTVYGAGLLFSPLLAAGGGAALIGRHCRLEAGKLTPYLRGLAALIMVMMGCGILGQVHIF